MLKRLTCISLLCLCLLFAACGKNTETQPTNKENMQLSIATMPSIDKVPLIIGIEKGFFEANGLTVTNQNFQSPSDRDAALASGNLDGVMTDIVAMAYYLEAGMDWKITSLVQTGFAVLASPESDLHELSDINSSSICGISLNGLIEYMADRAGITNKILLPSVSSRVEQLLANQIDLTVVPEPYGTMAMENGARLLASDDDLNIGAAVMLFSNEAITNNRDAVAAFYAGYMDSLEYLQNTEPDEYIDLIIEHGDFAAEIGDVLRNTTFDDLKMPSEEQYEDIIKWMRQKDESSEKYNLAFSEIIDSSFLPSK